MSRSLPLGILVTVASFAAASSAADSMDPTRTDGDKYTPMLENEQVRVLRYHDEPGARTHMHHHPNSVVYALSSFRRKLTLPDSSVRTLQLKPGDAIWVPEQTHRGENVGTTPTDVIIVELKPKP